MPRSMSRPLCNLAVASFVVALAAPARPCAVAPPPGVVVGIEDETALIVWDEGSRTEHFIRSASFATEASDFGFLVPTPAEPELAEVDADLFAHLVQAIQPGVEYRSRFAGVFPAPLICLPYLLVAGIESGSAPQAPVRILKEQQVAGYDAVVLEADDAGALATWLAEHGYDDRPALREWLEPYVAARAKLTAFKVARPAEGAVAPRIATSAVRMTFAAEAPFFPYREPADPLRPASPRRLLAFVVAPGPVEGRVGDAPWSAKLLWSDRVSDAWTGWLGSALPPGSTALRGAWLTAFEDAASTRSGEGDLTFPRTQRAAFHPPPRVVDSSWHLPIPVDVILGIGAYVYLRRRKRRRA